jgi:hypothetical protein
MPQQENSEIQIPIPFDSLIRAIDQLPTESLSQLLRATQTALAARGGTRVRESMALVEDEGFWEGELGQYIAAEADDSVSVEEVRKALSAIPGSLAEEISRERDER